MTFTDDAALEARCRALVGTITLPSPFSLDGLVEAVSTERGEPIWLRSLPADLGPEISGVLLGTDEGYVLCYPTEADPWWSLTCVAHELGHILCGHASTVRRPAPGTLSPDAVPGTAEPETPETAADAGTQNVAGMLPHLQEAAQAWGRLYRCDAHTHAEREAELVATLLIQRVERHARRSRPRTSRGNAGQEAVLRRFSSLLNGRRDRPF